MDLVLQHELAVAQVGVVEQGIVFHLCLDIRRGIYDIVESFGLLRLYAGDPQLAFLCGGHISWAELRSIVFGLEIAGYLLESVLPPQAEQLADCFASVPGHILSEYVESILGQVREYGGYFCAVLPYARYEVLCLDKLIPVLLGFVLLWLFQGL